MKHTNHYYQLVCYYNRITKKLQRLVAAGKNLRKQIILQKRILRLFHKLNGLLHTYKRTIAVAAFTTGTMLFQPFSNEAQVITFRKNGPFPTGLTDIGYKSTPAFADLDGDGDLDMLSGEKFGSFFYFENIGSVHSPIYAAAVTNPFGLTDIGFDSKPTFADINGDGDLDMIAGETNGSFYYFQNIGTKTAPSFNPAQINPFNLASLGVGFETKPTFVDIDNDGDVDILSGDYFGDFIYYKNIGNISTPVFAPAQTNPFGLSNFAWQTAPNFVDLDGDGDLDILSGDLSGDFIYFQNTGTLNVPAFTMPQVNPFGITFFSLNTIPAFADLDGDGDQDILTGESNGNFYYFENTGDKVTPSFSNKYNMGLKDIGDESSPNFTDLDGDGDQDMLSGKLDGNFMYFQNTGSSTVPNFAPPFTNPFGLTDIGDYSSPAFVDIDGDGNTDLFAGNAIGDFIYFRNIGTATNPIFGAPIVNPFNLFNMGLYSSIAFTDLDDDGDIDLLGESLGSFHYFKNTGTSTAPVFTPLSGNPFGMVSGGTFSTPDFADLDKDGDMDILTGFVGGLFIYYENTGTSTSPAFAIPQSNPFGLSYIGYASDPAFVDLDGDGDMDMLSGELYGNFYYFKNTTTCYGLTYFNDGDADGFGNASNKIFSVNCTAIAGYVKDSTDCNDNNSNVNPSKPEILGNGIDDNCDGFIDVVGIKEDNILSSISLFPNPANSLVSLMFELRESLPIAVKISDLSGKAVMTFPEEQLQQGEHSLQFNINQLSKGVYLLRINCGKMIPKNMMLIVK